MLVERGAVKRFFMYFVYMLPIGEITSGFGLLLTRLNPCRPQIGNAFGFIPSWSPILRIPGSTHSMMSFEGKSPKSFLGMRVEAHCIRESHVR